MYEFHDSNGNGFGDIWWTDKLIYFSSIDVWQDNKLSIKYYEKEAKYLQYSSSFNSSKLY